MPFKNHQNSNKSYQQTFNFLLISQSLIKFIKISIITFSETKQPKENHFRERERKKANLESVFVTMGLPEVLGDVAEVGDGNLIAFAQPSLDNIGDTPLGESEPEDSTPQVVVVVVYLRTRQRITFQSNRAEKPREVAGSVDERE